MSDRFQPNINWVRAAVCPALVFIATGLDRGYQTDFWHHIATGREIARSGRAATVDSFTFTVAGQSVRDANWLTQIVYFRLHEVGGLALVQTVNSLVLAAAAGVLVRVCRRRGASMFVAAAVCVLAFAGIWQTLLIRPQSVSLLLFVVLYAILGEAEHRRRLLLVPPVVMALWANVHGGFPIGLVLIGAFILGALVERRFATLLALLACFAASALATLLNPYGVGIYEYVLTLSSRAAGRDLEEWLPPSMALWVGRALFVSVLGLIGLLLFSPRKPRARELVVALCFLPLACASVRMVPWWLLAVAPVIAHMLGTSAKKVEQARPPRPALAAIMLGGIGVVVVLSTPLLERYNPVLGTLRPATRPEQHIQAMVDRIDDATPSRVFSRLEWGEYLVWSAYPKSSVFMDGRIEIYPDDVWHEYHAVTSARDDWETILARRGVDYLLLDSAFHGELMPRVESSPRWRRVDAAGPAVLYERRPAFDVAANDVHAVP